MTENRFHIIPSRMSFSFRECHIGDMMKDRSIVFIDVQSRSMQELIQFGKLSNVVIV